MARAQRCNGERSLSLQRALVIATPSARQLVESKGKVQWMQKRGSEWSKHRFTKSMTVYHEIGDANL